MRDAYILLVLWIIVGALVFSYLEGWQFLDALYFSVISITTVGYGDLVPSTPAGKFFTVVFLLVGVGLALYVLSIFSQRILGAYSKTERLLKRLARKEKELEKKERELEEREEMLERKEEELEKRVEALEKKLRRKR